VTSPQTSCTNFVEAAAAEYAIPDAAAGFAVLEMQPLMASHQEPPQSLFDDQLAHLIGEQPQLDDFVEVRARHTTHTTQAGGLILSRA